MIKGLMIIKLALNNKFLNSTKKKLDRAEMVFT